MNSINRFEQLLTVLAIALQFQCIQDAPFKVNHTTIPEQLDDGWELATLQKVGLNADSVGIVHSMLMDESKYFNALGLLVIKNDKLVFESYPYDLKDRDHFHHVQSATKSITSLLFGHLVANNFIDSLQKPIYNFFPDKFPSDSLKRTITIEHLLTMRSGLEIDNSEFAYNMLVNKPADQTKYLLDLPLYANPGDSFYYRDCDPQLISYIIQNLTEKTEEQLAKEILFAPLGITDYYWEPNNEGATCGAHGLHLRARDMAKIGVMVLHDGKWNNKQVVDSAWLAKATVPYAQTKWENITWNYGYYWWVLPQYQAFAACGHGGNFIFISPTRSMVIVMISKPDTNDDYVGTSLKRFIELISPIL